VALLETVSKRGPALGFSHLGSSGTNRVWNTWTGLQGLDAWLSNYTATMVPFLDSSLSPINHRITHFPRRHIQLLSSSKILPCLPTILRAKDSLLHLQEEGEHCKAAQGKPSTPETQISWLPHTEPSDSSTHTLLLKVSHQLCSAYWCCVPILEAPFRSLSTPWRQDFSKSTSLMSQLHSEAGFIPHRHTVHLAVM
jgi:hypothetical protein